MSNNDRNLDLNFLSGEEAVLIRDVLERDRLLKKREDERIRKLQEAGGVRNWLKVGSVQEARDFQSSAKHQPQQSFSTKTKGKNLSELTSRPHGLLGKQRDNQTTAALLKGASLRTRISSLFSFKSPQQKAEARLGSVGEGSSDDGRVLPVNTARPVSGAGEHTKEVPSLQRETFSPAAEHGQLKETATGEEEPRSHTRTSKSEPCQNNPRHKVVKASAILTGRNPKSQGNTEAGAPQPPHSHNGVLLTSPFSHGDNDSKPPSSVSQLPPSTMLSSALATVLAQPWSSRFRRQRAESGGGKEEEELRQEAGDWARFLKPCRPFTEEVPGCPGNKITTPKSHPFPGSQEQHFQDEDVFPGPDCRDGAPTESGMALFPTPPETPCITSTRSLDYQCYRRESQAGFLSPRFRERSSLLSSKPTTSSFLLSLRRLSSARGSPCTSSPFTNTPPASPGSCTLPGSRSITQERPRPSGELSRGVSIREGQLPPYTGRTGHRELTDWLNSLNAQSLKHRNTLSSSECRKGSQQDDDYITPSNFMTSAGNTTTGTNLNLLDFSNTATDTNHNLLSPNKNVTGPGNTTTSTSHNILSPESATSSINTTTFGQNHNLNSHSTYNHTHGLLNTYNARKTTLKSPSTLNPNTNLNSSETISSPKTPKLNTLKSTKTPFTPFGSNSSKRTYPPLSPNTPITPDTIKSPNTLFSPRIPISTNAPLSPNTPTTHSTLRSPNTPFSRKTPVRTNTPLSPNTPITSDSLRSPNTPSTLFSPNTCTYTPLSPNAPITPDTLKSPNTLFSPRIPISTTSPLSPNTPTAYNTLRSPNTPFSPKTPVSTNTPLSPNKYITRDNLERPNTASTQFSPNTCTYTPVSPNTPITPETPKSQNTPFSSRSHIGTATHLSPKTPISFNAHRSPTTPFSPKTHVSTNTLLSPNAPITPDSLRRPNTASTVFSPNTCTYTPVSPNTPITPEAPTSQSTSFGPKTPVSTNTPLSPNKSITRDNLERPNTASIQFIPNTCTYTPVSPNTPITPETPKSQNTPFSSRSHIGTATHLSPNTPISFNAHRSLTTPFSPKTHVSTNTLLSPNIPITPDSLRRPNTTSTVFSPNSCTYTPVTPNTPIPPEAPTSQNTSFGPKTPVSTNTPLSPNTPITSDSLRSPNTPSTLFSPNTCTYTPVSPNTPITPETPKSQNTPFSSRSHIGTATHLSPNTPISFNAHRSPTTPFSPKAPVSAKTAVSPNTPITPETPKSQNTPFSSRSHIGTATHLSPKTPISFNAHRSPTTPFSPKTHVSTNTLLSPNAPITPDSLRRPNTASTVFSPNTCTYTPVSPNTPITPEAPTSQSTSFGPKTPVSTNTPLSPNTPITSDSLRSPNTPSTLFSPNTCTYTPVSPNTPITPETPKSQNTPFSSRSHIGTATHLSPNTPISFNAHRSPTTPFSPKAPVSAKTAVSPNTPITPEAPTSQSTSFGPKTPVSTNTPLSPNTPGTAVSPNKPISTNISTSPNTFNRLNRQNILNSSKSLSNGDVGTVDSADISAINSPNSPISHKHLSSSPCSGSTLNSTKVPRLFLSRTQPVEDQAKANHTIIPSNAELEGVASCSTGKGKGGPEALKRSISPSHHPLLRRTSHTMEEPPFFSSLRTAGSSPCLLSPDPDQTVTPWRCHLSQGHNPSSRFTFDSGRDLLLVKSEKQAPLQNTSAPSLSSSQPLYSRDAELPPSTLAPHHVSWSSDRSWAVPMDSTGNITSPHSYEPGGETSLPVQFSVSAHLRTQPQSNTPACCKTSQDMFSFVPETNPQYSATGIGSMKGMRTDSTLQLSALQHPECKPQMSPNQSPASTDHFNQSFTSIIDSPTNQGSKRIGESSNKYSHSLPPPKTCIPPTKSKGIVGNKECDSLVEEHDPAVSMKHSSINRSPLMFSSKNNNFSPPVPGIATQPVASMCDGSGKTVTEGNKGNPKVYQVPSSIEMTKHFHDESLTTRKKSISMINMSSLVSEGSWAGDPGRWQDAGVLRPLNHENKTGSSKPRNQREAAGMHLPIESTQPGPVQNGNRRGLKNDNKNHSYQRYATVPGRPSCFDINSENVEYENAFYSTSTDATYPRSQRRKSTSFCEPEDVRQANINSLSPSTSLSPTRVFGLYHGRSFSVSSVHSSRPSGCGRISTGRKLGSSLDLCCADVDVTSWGLIDLGADVQQRATRSFSLNLDQDTTLERNLPPYHSEMSLSPLPSPPESPRPSRRISSSSTTSRSTLDTASPRSRLPSRGYRSSLSAFEESDSDTTTDDEYYLSPDRGERETEL